MTCVTAAVLCGCSPRQYRERADAEVYAVLDEVRTSHGLKTAGGFSIDTEEFEDDPEKVSANDVLSARSHRERKQLTVLEAVKLGRESSREFQSNKEGLYLAALTFTGERHRFRPQLSASSTATRSWTSGGPGEDREESGSVVSRASLGQALATGGQIGVNIVNNLMRFYTGDPRKSATTRIEASILQPLLRGAGRGIAIENLKQAFRDVVYEARDFRHFENTFSARIVVDYYRLLQQKDTIFNEYSNYRSRAETTEYLSARSVDRESLLDVKQAEQAELEAKNSYINSVVRFRTDLDEFKITLGLAQTTDLRLDDREMERLEEAELIPLFLDPDHGFAIALKHRLPLKNAIDRFEDARRVVRVTADALEPGLDLFGDVSISSDEPLDYYDFDLRDLQANVGIALDLPINKKLERNAYRASLIRFQQEARSLGLAFDELRNTIDDGIRQIQRLRQSYLIQKGAVKLAETRVEGARLNLQAGQAILRDLQDAQDSLISAQIRRTAALVDYMEARLNLLIELGILNTEVADYWISPGASVVDLSVPPADVLPDAFLEGDEIISPDELFSDG